MKRRSTILATAATLLLLVCGGILYLKGRWLAEKPANMSATKLKSASPLDLRPAAIAKLQSLVQSGSDSLYLLRIDSIHTNVSSGTITLSGVALTPG